jgi:transcriptional regulator GlxA family with amidase domain
MNSEELSNLDFARLAKSVRLSPGRLRYLFKREMGIPPSRYIRRLRMRQAAALLTTTFLSVKEIMARVGLGDESHFVRDFEAIYGLPPTRYRKAAVAKRQLSATKRSANK